MCIEKHSVGFVNHSLLPFCSMKLAESTLGHEVFSQKLTSSKLIEFNSILVDISEIQLRKLVSLTINWGGKPFGFKIVQKSQLQWFSIGHICYISWSSSILSCSCCCQWRQLLTIWVKSYWVAFGQKCTSVCVIRPNFISASEKCSRVGSRHKLVSNLYLFRFFIIEYRKAMTASKAYSPCLSILSPLLLDLFTWRLVKQLKRGSILTWCMAYCALSFVLRWHFSNEWSVIEVSFGQLNFSEVLRVLYLWLLP